MGSMSFGRFEMNFGRPQPYFGRCEMDLDHFTMFFWKKGLQSFFITFGKL